MRSASVHWNYVPTCSDAEDGDSQYVGSDGLPAWHAVEGACFRQLTYKGWKMQKYVGKEYPAIESVYEDKRHEKKNIRVWAYMHCHMYTCINKHLIAFLLMHRCAHTHTQPQIFIILIYNPRLMSIKEQGNKTDFFKKVKSKQRYTDKWQQKESEH